MITIVGVGHVFDLKQRIRQIITERGPDVVCVELDEARYRALKYGSEKGNVPLTYRLLAYFQDRMAGEYNSEPGSEMLTAIEVADEINARTEFIDMDAVSLWSHLRKSMSFREKSKLLFSSIATLFTSRKTVERELDNFQNNEEAYMEILGNEYPTMKKALVDDRNTYMAMKIRDIARFYRNVLVVVGDAHISGITRILGMKDIEVIRLKELQSLKQSDSGDKKESNEKAEVTISFTTEV